ncbi:bifunctional ADP-dependent (S)-NAD(P)H-hydrate dehydratase/NAD(P)H-hydrate epimerase [Candidatus Thiodiazotropha endoloripes]|uniref:bifunctional ADP-dependent NAD(P)H-hydrate dehydratase/NAD(P)H-hydrate epimerase n=1 Tax=Candidatus Thiodiazotropha endoloripes TaxID=1818881 RepID=UPI00083D11A6|nr:bifunctional ADP-dependent NAD(P)H-hydrate dehydratase/NAD(P)H-hydrate epimerase [Candidatus Thiodiazotropha endoloripes]ODB82293.1 bifunctional ADP-dependent (S)-NAD(P)H-hydrate dehydratase/NAD(P)H-hydrate epimerase [Candidatus Thiodiazotropha endoloripes]
MRVMPFTDSLPYALYRADQVRQFDHIAIDEFEILGETLMERAGIRAFDLLRHKWPELREILVVCGLGNNGGDGYVLARLALQAGLRVRVLQLGDAEKIKGDALLKAKAWMALGQQLEPFQELPGKPGLIVDAILGTGLERDLSGDWKAAVDQINRHQAPVFALDIPSGLNSDSGRVMGCAVRAAATISFIGLKQGMFTGNGPDCCGEVVFDALEIPAQIYARQLLACRRMDWSKVSGSVGRRERSSHKGSFGHLLLVGGDQGYSGAIRLAAEGGARSGAGLVTLATHPQHAPWSNLGRPELMCRGVDADTDLTPLLQQASAVVLGPGLGRSPWGEQVYHQVTTTELPLLLDADALYWLARQPNQRNNRVLTPHPGEAARLLDWDTQQVQSDRFAACEALQQRYGGVVVLKGAGTLVGGSGSQPVALCSDGNPGMASGGSGDVLSGVIGAFLAQGYALRDAAELGVCLHAAAGDKAAREGEIGMLAGDLIDALRETLNSELVDD